MADVMITNMGRTEGKRYMISDAARLVDVESHVLRYWEEELDIEIPRNEMGHRYYTDYYINAFRKIKELKDQGFLLKAIKIALPEIMNGGQVDGVRTIRDEVRVSEAENQIMPMSASVNTVASVGGTPAIAPPNINQSKESKMEQFQMILGNIVSEAIKENNKELTTTMSKDVSETVIKEMDYLLRLKEEREEERFKKFDEIVRGLQRDNKENAIRATEKKRRLFSRSK